MLPIAMVEANTRAGNTNEYFALDEAAHFVRSNNFAGAKDEVPA
jgi:hypothetical protein